MSSAHGLADVFGVGENVGAVRSESHSYGDGKDRSADEQVFPAFFLEMVDELYHPHQAYQHEEVVKHLRMLCGACGHEYRCEDRSQKVFLFRKNQVEASEHNCRGGYGHGLGEMSRTYDNQEIRRQTYGYRPH